VNKPFSFTDGTGPKYRLGLRPNSDLVLYQDQEIIWRTGKTGANCYSFVRVYRLKTTEGCQLNELFFL
jgi:hypothetical protein